MRDWHGLHRTIKDLYNLKEDTALYRQACLF